MAVEKVMPSKMKRMASGVVAVAAFAAAYVGALLLFSESPEEKAAELGALLQQLAEKENPPSPKTMEDGTTLVSVSASGKDITYTYTVPPARETDAKYGNFAREEKLRYALCSGNAKAVIDAGANFVFVYIKEGSKEELGRSKVWICI